MTLKEFLRETEKMVDIPGLICIQEVRPVVKCADGFTVSIQASENHYCTPRHNGLKDKYETVELGFPSAEDALINEFADDPTAPTETVYVRVPIHVVEQLLHNHGGISGLVSKQR